MKPYTQYPYNNTQKKPIIDISTEKKVFIGIGLLTLVILVGGVWFLSVQGAKEEEKLNKGLLGEKIQEMPSSHVKPGASHASYNSNPPTSGPMYDDVAGPGFHDTEVPDEKAVHSMEHGAAIVWYKADLPKETVDLVKNAFDKASGKSVMLPRKNLDVPVALTSWGRLSKIKAILPTEIALFNKEVKDFIETNNDRAPEKSSMY